MTQVRTLTIVAAELTRPGGDARTLSALRSALSGAGGRPADWPWDGRGVAAAFDSVTAAVTRATSP